MKLTKDEGNRPDTNLEGLAKLQPVAGPDKWITAGNASQLSDGASAAVIMSDAAPSGWPIRGRHRAAAAYHAAAHAARRAAPAEVAAQHAEQRGQQRGTQQRLGVGQRIGHPDGAAALVVGGQAERVEDVRRDERVGQHLDVAGLGQRPADTATAALHGVSPLPGGATGSTLGTLSYPSSRTTSSTRSAGPGEVGPPGRRGDPAGSAPSAVTSTSQPIAVNVCTTRDVG